MESRRQMQAASKFAWVYEVGNNISYIFLSVVPFSFPSDSWGASTESSSALIRHAWACDRSSLYRWSVTSQFSLNLQDAHCFSPLHLLVSMKSAPDHRSYDGSFCLYHSAVARNPGARSTKEDTSSKCLQTEMCMLKKTKTEYVRMCFKNTTFKSLEYWNFLCIKH